MGGLTKTNASFREGLRDGEEFNTLRGSNSYRIDAFERKLWIAVSILANNSSLEFERDWIYKVKLLGKHWKDGQKASKVAAQEGRETLPQGA
jgi:hypothetical protein